MEKATGSALRAQIPETGNMLMEESSSQNDDVKDNFPGYSLLNTFAHLMSKPLPYSQSVSRSNQGIPSDCFPSPVSQVVTRLFSFVLNLLVARRLSHEQFAVRVMRNASTRSSVLFPVQPQN